MILEYASVRMLLQSTAPISSIFIYGKNGDGCDNNIVLLRVVINNTQFEVGSWQVAGFGGAVFRRTSLPLACFAVLSPL